MLKCCKDLEISKIFYIFAVLKIKKQFQTMDKANILFQGKISSYECTDRDNMQFCRKINEHEFEYIQLKETKLVSIKEITKNDNPTMALVTALQYTEQKDWYYEIIDVNDLSKEDIDELLDCYGNFGYDSKDKVPNQLIAEAWFEQSTCMEM